MNIQSLGNSATTFNVSTTNPSQSKTIINEQEEKSSATAARSTKVSSSTTGTVETSVQGDTVELSTEGVAKSNELPPATSSTASAISSAANEVVSEDSDTEDLSTYTTTQLKEMLDAGTITQAEYNSEIASREEE